MRVFHWGTFDGETRTATVQYIGFSEDVLFHGRLHRRGVSITGDRQSYKYMTGLPVQACSDRCIPEHHPAVGTIEKRRG